MPQFKEINLMYKLGFIIGEFIGFYISSFIRVKRAIINLAKELFLYE